MTKKQFVEYVKALLKTDDLVQQCANFKAFRDYHNIIVSAACYRLGNLVADPGGYVKWWVVECAMCGVKGKVRGQGKEQVTISTPEQLYDFIKSEVKRREKNNNPK